MESRLVGNGMHKLMHIFLSLFFRAHILRHGKILLWAKWTGSAEKAAVWISGCRSSTCLNDEPVNGKKPARGLDNLLKSGVNPDGHITIQRSNSKVFQNVDEARKVGEKGIKKKKLSTGRSVLELHPLASASEKGRRGAGRELNQSMRVLFNVTADTVQKDGIMYVWWNICEASREHGGTRKQRCGTGQQPLCRNQALVQTLDLLCNFTR